MSDLIETTALETTALPEFPLRLLIGGEWWEAASGKRFATLNPATEEVLAEVSEAEAPEIDAAVAAARDALRRGAWPGMTGAERGRILYRLAGILRERAEEGVVLESIDRGKPPGAPRAVGVASPGR